MPFVDLHAVEKACIKPAPGLKAVAMIDPQDLENQPDWHVVPVISDLEFKPGKAAYDLPVDQITGRLSDNTDTARPGDVIEYNFKAAVAKVSASMEWLKAKLLNRRIHLVVTYQDDSQRFLPYIRLTIASDSGDASSKNQNTVRGILKLSKPAPYFEGTIEVIGGGGSGGGSGPGSPDVSDAEVIKLPVNTTAASITQSLPEGVLLIAVWVRGNTDQTVKVGLTAGGDELGGPQDLAANEAYNFAQTLRTTAATDIIVSGLAGSNSVEFWYCATGEGDIVKVSIAVTETEYEYALISGVLLAAIYVAGDQDQTVSIGLTASGDELGGPQDIEAGNGYTFAQTLRTDGTTNIYFTGLAGNNTIEIWYAI